jgi:hypothetical protein
MAEVEVDFVPVETAGFAPVRTARVEVKVETQSEARFEVRCGVR